jgi:large subunit ribosomal protein L25
MEKVELSAKTRVERGRRVNKGRKEGLVPAVLYGKGLDSVSLWVNAIDIKRLLKKSGESTIIDLKIDEKDNRKALISDIQKDPVRGVYRHLDFHQVNMKEELETEVELVFIGESEAVKALGGVLVKSINKIVVKCLPADLPSHVDVDISALKTFEDHITIKNLSIPKNVKVELEEDVIVALVSAPRSEDELSGLDAKVDADVTKVEGVIKPEAVAEEKGAKK